MRTLLNLPDPSVDWRGLAHVIAKTRELRDDVTMVIERDRLRFFDAECREISTALPPEEWAKGSMRQLSAKLSLLDWLHEHFPRSAQEAVVPIQGGRRAASFFS